MREREGEKLHQRMEMVVDDSDTSGNDLWKVLNKLIVSTPQIQGRLISTCPFRLEREENWIGLIVAGNKKTRVL